MAINTITISGNLGKDAECRSNASGDLITRLSIAFAERRKKADGTWDDSTGWINAVIFGTRGEKLCSVLKKGTPVTVSGKLAYSTYLDKDKNKRTSYQIIVSEIFIGAKRKKDDDNQSDALADYDYDF